MRSFVSRTLFFFTTLTVSAFIVAPTAYAQTAPAADAYASLPWRHIGPEGNRFSAAAGISGDPYTYYVGAASGGIYKTTDGGVNWDAIFDDQPVQSMGSIDVADADPNVVWAGTGEGKIRSHVSVGQGIYKSTDAGATWTLMGLEQTGRIPRVIVHPSDINTVYVCALGHSYGPQPERGVYRTTDGGATWEHILFVDEDTGCSDLAIDPNNPRVLFAGTWQLEIHTWGRTSGGAGGGLHVTRDGGDTWERLGPGLDNGLPMKPVGKVAVAISYSNPQRVFAMLETGDGIPWDGQPTEDGQLWRSEDGGHTWAMITRNRNAMGRPHYYSRLVISPDDQDEAYFLTASFAKSTRRRSNAQHRAHASTRPAATITTCGSIPANSDRMIVAHDQGLSISINRGETWFRQRLTNAQMYHVTVDNAVPYNVLGNKQDEPTYRGPSNSRHHGPTPRPGDSPGACGTTWAEVRAAGPHPIRSIPTSCGPRLRDRAWWAASSSATKRSAASTAAVEVWPEQSRGAARDVRYRFVWDAPVHISPHDHNTVYVGSQHVHRTQNGGQSWETISPDLSLNDSSRMGALRRPHRRQHRRGVRRRRVFGIAESPIEPGLIWAGTNDGLLHVTRDGGGRHVDRRHRRTCRECRNGSPSAASLRLDTMPGPPMWPPTVIRSTSATPTSTAPETTARRWEKITNGIPPSMLSYTKVIAEDPVRQGLAVRGHGERHLRVSFDDGRQLAATCRTTCRHAPVSGIVDPGALQ